ncbi:MAG: hypothetical protein QOE41_4910 [Mycobacterium sp.]|nr:hypothetical protein [Mycobacterium sp.]
MGIDRRAVDVDLVPVEGCLDRMRTEVRRQDRMST